MKNYKIIIFIVIAIIVLIGSYFLLFGKKDEDAAFLRLEKLALTTDEKKVTVNKKEVSLKISDGLYINNNRLEVELINNVYNTGDYLIVSYQGTTDEKYLFIDGDGNQITVTREGINEDAEFSKLRLEGNKLLTNNGDTILEISYKEEKIIIKK